MNKGFLIGALWGLVIGSLVFVVASVVLERKSEQAVLPKADPVSQTGHDLAATSVLDSAPRFEGGLQRPEQMPRSLWPRPPAVHMPAIPTRAAPPPGLAAPGSGHLVTVAPAVRGIASPQRDVLPDPFTALAKDDLVRRSGTPATPRAIDAGPSAVVAPKGPTPPQRMASPPIPVLVSKPILPPAPDLQWANVVVHRDAPPQHRPGSLPQRRLSAVPAIQPDTAVPVSEQGAGDLLATAPSGQGEELSLTGPQNPAQPPLDRSEAGGDSDDALRVAFVLSAPQDGGQPGRRAPAWAMTQMVASADRADAGSALEQVLAVTDPFPTSLGFLIDPNAAFGAGATEPDLWSEPPVDSGVIGVLGLDKGQPDAFLAIRRAGLPGVLVYSVLDGANGAAQLGAVVERARRDGQVAVLVRNDPATLAAIDDWFKTGAGSSVQPVPLSALMP
ncbi:hypothetical protein [Pseudoruegeria sp. SK021]|uniref:hypothetical protein n=1 Tax=Pseudoruegeria sp. SK021 TaxID=1933035 RepID=UPI000A26132D|nr:hypothetical protein [Pseudoruegeria sp. SK021]OSP56258.1 hypothetical protein BV911_02920 [Pseudoruegeria sp. SK021]